MNVSRFAFILPVLASAGVLGACTMTPHYRQPALPVADAWPVAPANGAATPADDTLAWRAVFHDERLQRVISRAIANNRDLRIAVLNIQKARSGYRMTRSGLLPSLNAQGAESHSLTPASVSQTGSAIDATVYSAQLAVPAWELDLFGRVQSQTKAAFETYLQTAETRRAALFLF